MNLPFVQTRSNPSICETNKQTNKQKMNTKRPLHRMLMEPDSVDLNANLEAAKKLNASKDNSPSLRAPDALVELTDKSIATPILAYKVYTLLVWIMIHPAIRKFFAGGINAKKYDDWISRLQAQFDLFLFGLKADGTEYKKHDNLQNAKVGVFVTQMAAWFTDM